MQDLAAERPRVAVEDPGARYEAASALYEDGQYHAAYEVARAHGLLEVSRTTETARGLLAARLLHQMGASRRARKLTLEIWRRHRRDPDACVRCALELSVLGPLTTLDFMARVGDLGWAPPDAQSDWLCTRALQLMVLRDFRAADEAWDAARARATDAWTWCVRALLDDARDRPEEAREAIARARASRPWYRPAIDVEARLLLRTRRFEEARTLLEEAAERLEAPSILIELHLRQREDGNHAAALRTLERLILYSPEMERDLHDAITGWLAYVHYLRGDLERCRQVARLATGERCAGLLRRVDAKGEHVRKVLPVPQVPQHHNTCSPATLTSIAEHWRLPVAHVELAEEICYDGTPAVSERRWARDAGFVARELTVTWDATVRLIDAGLPFALATVGTVGAHLQAVVGYDTRGPSLLVRDPGAFTLVEYDVAVLEDQRAFGPRGLVVAPGAQAAALAALELPDAALYDLHFQVEDALRSHDRAAAGTAAAELAARAPDHLLRHQARRALANYDGDEHGFAEWTAGLLAQHPKDRRLRLYRLAALRRLASRGERVALAEGLLADDPNDPGILAECAALFAETEEGVARAERLARGAVRSGPSDAHGYRILASLCWDRGDRRRATALYRIASCLAAGDETMAWSYFVAARITADVDAALQHLRDRVDRAAGRSAQPAQTLCDAYHVLGRVDEAIAILDQALADHPDDGDLLLVAADQRRLAGDGARAATLLERARGRCREGSWRRAAAHLAAHEGRVDDALALWRGLAEDQPLDVASQHAYVALLVRSGRWDDAVAHLGALCARFPFHVGLGQLFVDLLAERDEGAARRHLATFLAHHPTSGWGLRRLAGLHADAGDLAEARALLERARACDQDRASLELAEGGLCRRAGEREHAREHYRAAIRTDFDSPEAIAGLLGLAADAREAIAELELAGAELERQGSYGAGVAALVDAIRTWRPPREALARLRALRERVPHLVVGWSAEIDALLDAGELDEAHQVATELVGRFSLVPDAWRALARVHERRDARAERVAALERALELDPHDRETIRLLSDASLAAGDARRARALLERALAADPLSGLTHGYLADVARRGGDAVAARKHLRQAVLLTPEYGWAWDQLVDEPERGPALALEVAREVLVRAPRAVRARQVIAEHDTGLALDERIAILREAGRIAPHDPTVHDVEACLLASWERWDEALAACRPPFWGDDPPRILRGRRAWLRREMGEEDRAYDEMVEAVAASPTYAWGIHHLVAWARGANDPLVANDRLRRAVQAAQGVALLHAHLGETRRLLGNDEGAEESFRAALALDPEEVVARLGIADLLLVRGELEEAATHLARLPPDAPTTLARAVRLHAAAGRADEAEAAFVRLVRSGVEDDGPVAAAVSALVAAGQTASLDARLDELVRDADAPEPVGWAWRERYASSRSLAWRWWRFRRMVDSPARRWCLQRELEQLGEERGALALGLLVVLDLRFLRARTETWGSVGFSLVRNRWVGMASWWLRDYARRPGVAQWMLTNLVVALFARGRVLAAWRVARDALALPADQTTHLHRLVLAAPDVLAGDLASARTAIELGRLTSDALHVRFLADLAEIMIEHQTVEGDTSTRMRFLGHRFRVLWHTHAGATAEPMCLRQYRRIVRDVCARVGGLTGLWWRLHLALVPWGW